MRETNFLKPIVIHVVEGSIVPLLFLISFNYGFTSLIYVLPLSQVLRVILMCLASPALLYLSTKNLKK